VAWRFPLLHTQLSGGVGYGPGHQPHHLTMPGKQRAHYAHDYQRRARAVRQAADTNPLTLCARCGEPARPDDPWDAGHERDGDPTSPLRAEHASCNRSAGATLGNRRRIKLTTTRNW